MKAYEKGTRRKYYKYVYNWTSSSTFTPKGTITATSGFLNYLNAFDGNSTTYASCGTLTDYIDIVTSTPMRLTGFTMTGQYVDGSARAENMAIFSVNDGVETLLVNGSGANITSTYTVKGSFSETETNHIRFKLITWQSSRPPSTSVRTRVREITITGKTSTVAVIESTEDDYDYYIDMPIYKVPKKNDKYYGIKQ